MKQLLLFIYLFQTAIQICNFEQVVKGVSGSSPTFHTQQIPVTSATPLT